MKIILFLSLNLLLVSCVKNTKSSIVAIKTKSDETILLDRDAKIEVAADGISDKIVCGSRRKTGTHFKTRYCTTKAKQEADRKNAQKALDSNKTWLTRKLVIEAQSGGAQ